MAHRNNAAFDGSLGVAFFSALLAGSTMLTPAHAAPCSTAANTASSTTCENGSTAATLTYQGSNPLYVSPPGGDFTLLLRNHDVNAAAGNGITFSGVVGGNGTITLENDSDVVSGAGGDGINSDATNSDTTINVKGTSSVTGAKFGIFAKSTGSSITVNTEASSTVIGNGEEGIHAEASTSGDAEVDAQGAVTGKTSGIAANAVFGKVKVTTGTADIVGATENGIKAEGYGGVTVSAGGNIKGFLDGILGYATRGNVNVTTAAGTLVSGGDSGIDVETGSFGDIDVNAQGAVSGAADGIQAKTRAGTVKIATGGGAVTAMVGSGIYAEASSTVTVEAGGDVRGMNGIVANSTRGGSVTVKTAAGAAVHGSGGVGIKAIATDAGTITITNNAEATGGDTGVEATSETGAILITNNNLIANGSVNSAHLAIRTSGGAATIKNNGQLIGTVELGLASDTLTNEGVWNTARGSSSFGEAAGDADKVDNKGLLIAADDGSAGEDTVIDGIERFDNSGVITLADGGANDSLTLRKGVDYDGADGRLVVDAVLAPGMAGAADQLIIIGDTSGTTKVSVNVVGLTGANTDGISVIQVLDGVTDASHFVLADGPISAGFFTWDMRLDFDTHELFTSGAGVGAYEFAGGITAAQDIWHQTTGTLLQRQADLRVALSSAQVMPVADFTAPVDPTPAGEAAPGLWFKGTGAYLTRDDDEDGFTLDRKQTIFGGLGGFDFGAGNVGVSGDAVLFGIFAGYLTSDLDFRETNSKWSYEGPSIGAYATYLNAAFYIDAVAKVDFLSIDIDPKDLAPGSDDADTDGLNFGGLIDAGYKFAFAGGAFIEPQAALAAVRTEIDDVDIFGGTVEFDDETSLRGRLGLRLGVDHGTGSGTVFSADATASVWQEFAGDNDVTIAAPDFPTFGASDAPGKTVGDVGLGVSITAADGWSSFLRGNYQFADEYEAFAANAGLRFAW